MKLNEITGAVIGQALNSPKQNVILPRVINLATVQLGKRLYPCIEVDDISYLIPDKTIENIYKDCKWNSIEEFIAVLTFNAGCQIAVIRL